MNQALSSYHTFGSSMPGYSYKAASVDGYRFGFNGEENILEIIGFGNIIDLGERYFDGRYGRMFSTDPRKTEYSWQSPYAYFKNSPLSIRDIKGLGGTSTHLDPKGRVIAVYNDGDNSIYKHQTADTKEKVDYWREHFGNTSGNGIKVGETIYWYDFMKTNEKDGTLLGAMTGSTIDNDLTFSGAQINKVLQNDDYSDDGSVSFGSGSLLLSTIQSDFKEVMATKSNDFILTGKSSLKEYKQLVALKDLSKNGGDYDIKVSLLNPTAGYLYEVRDGINIYTTGRAMGNILFGSNVRQVYDNSDFLKNNIIDPMTSTDFYNKVFSEVGRYNIKQNGAKPKNMDFFGEHPYSGSFQYLGYFNYVKPGF